MIEFLAVIFGGLIASISFIWGYNMGSGHTRKWREILDPPAVVTIDRSGWLTIRPQVCVGIESKRGAQNVYCFAEDDVGIASAEMHGRDLAEIAGLRLVDRRESQI